MVIGIFIVVKYGNILSLTFTAVSFFTKTGGLLILTWLGVGYLDLNFKIYIPILTSTWFISHLLEAFIIQKYLQGKSNKLTL
tara:strand:+ start:323 stop:568 length:246 start_codon:yes stop_codon:yes gene_type:complete